MKNDCVEDLPPPTLASTACKLLKSSLANKLDGSHALTQQENEALQQGKSQGSECL